MQLSNYHSAQASTAAITIQGCPDVQIGRQSARHECTESLWTANICLMNAEAQVTMGSGKGIDAEVMAEFLKALKVVCDRVTDEWQ